MSNKRKATSALFPIKADFPESRKVMEASEGNEAIYNFFDFLLDKGYVLARRDPESGQLRAMKTRPTVEHEVLLFRGVDKLAYALECDALRAAYPHLWAKYNLGDEPVQQTWPEFADMPEVPAAAEVPEAATPTFTDDTLMTLSQAWNNGVFTMTPSHAGVRVKMTRCRRAFPDLMPKIIARGGLTFYRVGDLRRWEHAYTERAADRRADVQVRGGWHVGPQGAQPQVQPEVREQPVPVEAIDALEFLMRKIRGEEE